MKSSASFPFSASLATSPRRLASCCRTFTRSSSAMARTSIRTTCSGSAICERGTSFGYNNLIVDMLGMVELKKTDAPIIFDVTHSLQRPGGLGNKADGRSSSVFELARAGMSLGLAGLFLETHPDPAKALCDGPCALRLDDLDKFLSEIKSLDDLIKSYKEK